MKPRCEAPFEHIFSVAPMLDWTDKHCRFFLRLLSKRALLYTEMITTAAILHNDPKKYLDFNLIEKPLVLQLGGSNPDDLKKSAKIGEEFGYDQINLNIGCPSARVQSGRFGACLMKEPELVAECISAIRSAIKIPITIKTRIGVDEHDHYDNLYRFIKLTSEAGCTTYIIHARKAWLKGLSPKENREIPPLQYDIVDKLQQDFTKLSFILNGGIKTIEQAKIHLKTFPGVMLGRAIMDSPYILSQVDQEIYNIKTQVLTREEVFEEYKTYIKQQKSVPITVLARPLMGLYNGLPGAKKWRRELLNYFIFP